MRKRKMIIALAALSSLAALAGCGKSDTDKETVISMLLSDSAVAPFNSEWQVLKEIEEKKSVKLDVQVVPASEYATKRSVVMASGDIPDILTNTWANQIGQYAVEGMMFPVSDYLDKLPNLNKIITEWNMEDTIADITELDGKFYVLPSFEKNAAATNGFAVRKDIFEKHGIAYPETYDELLNVLMKLKELYPESLGVGDLYNGKLLMSFVASSFDTKGGYSLPYGYCYDYGKEEWCFAPTSEEYRELLTYLNRIYEAGCMDPEAFTQDAAQFSQKVLNEKYFVIPAFGQSNIDKHSFDLKGLGVEGAEFEMLYPLAGPDGIRKGKPCGHYIGGNAMPASVAEREDLDKVLDFVDWLYYSEDAALMSAIGKDGLTYTMDGENYVLNKNIKTVNQPDGNIELNKEYGFGVIGFTTLVAENIPDSAMDLIRLPKETERKKYMIENGMVDKDDPTIKFTQEQSEQAKLLYTNLNDYTNSMIVKFIYGEESLDNWDEYVNKCRDMGSEELIELVNTAWKENNKR